MAIKKLQNRAKPYRVYWRNPYSKKIETTHFETSREAEEHDSKVKHWLKFEPQRFAPAEELPASEITVEYIVWAYLQDRQLKPKSLRDTIYHLKKVLPAIGHVYISQLAKSHMRDLVKYLRDHGLKPNGINRKVSIIKAALNWAENEELIELNPVRNFSCPRGTDDQVPPPTPHELKTILQVAPHHLQRVIILGLAFGVRVGESELFKLTWDDVDFHTWNLRVWSAEKNKNAQWRELHIKESLRALLKDWREQDREIGTLHLINWKGKPVTTIKRSWKTALKAAGITRRIRPYDLRHAHATEALANGADIKALAENMGHTDTSMIHKHYQHVLIKQRNAALESVPDLVILSGNTKEGVLGDFSITTEDKIQ
ncbi:site-specific integrase [Maridesulfovibrio ferrireducens]|uniref:tyrosine-type recombinase/integrase n=1 Tax=Maridesulfovibrio ferrireducens TaxID=246191 RepID=UPI001A19BAA0|nr:site-specific integrase [Maridesulfovibrio ferrireducens]MBI9112428.1 site-specific integrase [Maridesulfovibrio ferrireducens]